MRRSIQTERGIYQLSGNFDNHDDFLDYLRIKKSEQAVNFNIDSFNEEIAQSILREKINPQDAHFVRYRLEEMGISEDAIDIFLQFNTKTLDDLKREEEEVGKIRKFLFGKGGILFSKKRKYMARVLISSLIAGVIGYSQGESKKEDKGETEQENPGITGTEYMEQCKEQNTRHCDDIVLDAVSKYNMTSSWNKWKEVSMKSKDKKHEAKFYVMPHAVRVGTDENYVELPVDGPHATAIAKITNLYLMRPSVITALHKQAKAKDHHAKFFHVSEAYELMRKKYPEKYKEQHPSDLYLSNIMVKPDCYEAVDTLRHEWLTEHHVENDELISGYFKNVTRAKTTHLNYWGAYEDHPVTVNGEFRKNGLLHKGMDTIHPQDHIDYSQNIRLMIKYALVDKEKMNVDDFLRSKAYSKMFGFTEGLDFPSHDYKLSDELKEYVEEHKWKTYNPNEDIFPKKKENK